MQLMEAYQLAARLHGGQLDKAGRPYIEHLTRVFLRVQEADGDMTQQIAALLHDAIEDKKATAEQLISAGVPSAAVDLVLVLSKRKDVPYLDYLACIKADSRALLVKLADLADNSDPDRLALLSQEVAAKLRRKYEEASLLLNGGVTRIAFSHCD